MPFSCFLFRPRKRLEKRRKRSHTNVSNTLVTRTSIPPVQTAHVRFHRRKWVHYSPSPTGLHTRAYTPKHGAFQMGALSLPSERSARFGNPAWPGGRTANFAAFWSWLGGAPEERREPRNSDALMRVAVPRRRGPAGLRRPTPPTERTVLAPISPRVQLCLRRPAFPLSAFIPGA